MLFDVLIINNTIVDNVAGGGISLDADEPYTITNNIIWGNTPQDLPRGSATFSNIESGNTLGFENLSVDPEFIDRINDDYRLAGTSPCIDAGTDAIVPVWLTTDFEGDTRIFNTVDMGADEYIP